MWRFHGLRPANHPQRRLALASSWCVNGSLVAKLEEWCIRELPNPELLDSLHEVVRIEPDEFWSCHYTFRSPRLKKALPLVGKTRVTDLAINVVLPWLWIRAGKAKMKNCGRKSSSDISHGLLRKTIHCCDWHGNGSLAVHHAEFSAAQRRNKASFKSSGTFVNARMRFATIVSFQN